VCKDPSFYKEVLKKVGEYKEGPTTFLKSFKECVWEEWERRSGEDYAWKHSRLCSLCHLMKVLSECNAIAKVSVKEARQ
jgi:hypothetical protein